MCLKDLRDDAVEMGIQAYLEFTRTLTSEMNTELEGHKDNEVPET